MNKSSTKHLIIYLTIMALAILALSYFIMNNNPISTTLIELVKEIIPDLISSLFAFLLIYFFFTRIGINPKDTIQSKTTPDWLVNGFEKYTDISWTSYIDESSQISIIAFYIDNWIETHDAALRNFLTRESTSITVFLPNYENINLLTKIVELMPSYSNDSLKSRISLSITKLKSLNDPNNMNKKIKIYLYDRPFNYTLEKFDEKYVFISINELYRNKEYQSPFFMLDLTQSKKIAVFIKEEIASLAKFSNLIKLGSWRA